MIILLLIIIIVAGIIWLANLADDNDDFMVIPERERDNDDEIYDDVC